MPPIKDKCADCGATVFRVKLLIGDKEIVVSGPRVEIAHRIKEDIWGLYPGYLPHKCPPKT